ncbi:Apolipoprotein O-like [Stylophora pistillata]|uniref:MICOS complex subunit n=1 Tax=Stylophora pistillata TaxID=50429 RepID=A0A2B4RQU9_STYPI|nr:Apolipoprotein O-like [Stylophora pistillata]
MLEIYDEPVEISKVKPDEEEVSAFEEKVSVARRFVWGWTSTVKDGIDKTRRTFSSVEERSIEFVQLLHTDRQFQMKVGGITAAVFGGALLAGRGRRPIRRLFFSSVLGTTAAAICYPNEAVLISQKNYHRLKTFIKEQWEKHNERQAERAAKGELKTSVDETKTLEGQKTSTAEEVKAETASADVVKEEVASSQNKVKKQETQETTTEPVVVSTENTSQGSFWSKIPFVDKFMAPRPSEAHEVKRVEVVESSDKTGSSKDQVIVQEETSSDVPKAEGDTGQSNPEDKDMYSTRS